MEKKIMYVDPALDIVEFGDNDIITTSNELPMVVFSDNTETNPWK